MVGINMEMPKSCEECDFADYEYWDGYCAYLGIGIDKEYKNERHPKCPLIDLDKENK